MADPNRLSRSVKTDRQRKWTERLAILTSAFVLFLTLSGLSIWLLPFSITNQFLVLAHSIAGALLLLPVSWYSLTHWLSYRRNQMTHLKLLGYLGVFSLLTANVSGVVLLVQAIASPSISYGWDAFHIVATIAVLAFVLPHVLLIVRRDLSAANALLEGARGHGKAVALLLVGAAGVVALAVYAYPPPRLEGDFPADYSFPYGPDRPFAPSLATTESGRAYADRLLSGSEGCGTPGCHEEIYREWEVSAHRYAAMDPAFQGIQLNMAQQNRPESTRYCGGCHDPISLFSGTKNLFTDPEKLTALEGYQEGVSCLVCHAVREVDVKGNANFVLGRPSRYLFEIEYDASPGLLTRTLRDFLIRAYPREHVDSLAKTLFKTPDYCAGCHKQFIDQEINQVGWVQLQNQFDNWRKSRWNHPGDPQKTIECRECHMPLMESRDPASGDASDYNRTESDGKHRSHRFLGANQMMPELLKLRGWEEQVELIESWLRGEIEIPEIADKWAGGAAVGIELEAPDSVKPGERLPIQVVVTSNKVGHDFPTGPLDIIQSWVELVVRDERGKVWMASGVVDARGFIQPGSFMFKAEPVDRYGNLIDRHNLWEMVGVRHRRALFPGFSDTAEFEMLCPDLRRVKKRFTEGSLVLTAPTAGSLEITARLLYRKIDQYLINFLFGEASGIRAPITEMAFARRTVRIEF